MSLLTVPVVVPFVIGAGAVGCMCRWLHMSRGIQTGIVDSSLNKLGICVPFYFKGVRKRLPTKI